MPFSVNARQCPVLEKYQELTPLNIAKVRISIKLNAENWLKTKAYLNNYNLNRALKYDI